LNWLRPTIFAYIVELSVVIPGPPAVITKIMSKILSASTIRRRIVIIKIDDIIGSVT
ncbi:unnamed protein product, partial [marine sediment metagenome]